MPLLPVGAHRIARVGLVGGGLCGVEWYSHSTKGSIIKTGPNGSGICVPSAKTPPEASPSLVKARGTRGRKANRRRSGLITEVGAGVIKIPAPFLCAYRFFPLLAFGFGGG